MTQLGLNLPEKPKRRRLSRLSLEAYENNVHRFTENENHVMEILNHFPEGLTSKEIYERVKHRFYIDRRDADREFIKSRYQPRISDLKGLGFIKQIGRRDKQGILTLAKQIRLGCEDGILSGR